MFCRFRTVFCKRNDNPYYIVTLYEYCVRLISPFDLACVRARVRACGRVSTYRYLFLYFFIQICNNPSSFFKNTIRNPYELL